LDEKRDKDLMKGEDYETKTKGQISTSGYQGRITPSSGQARPHLNVN